MLKGCKSPEHWKHAFYLFSHRVCRRIPGLPIADGAGGFWQANTHPAGQSKAMMSVVLADTWVRTCAMGHCCIAQDSLY